MAGRKNAYVEKIQPNLELIRAWKRRGLEDKQIYEALEISSATFYKYAAEKREFKEVLKKSAEEFLVEIENKAYELAKAGDTKMIEKILNRNASWAINEKDREYFKFKKEELEIKKKINNLLEDKANNALSELSEEELTNLLKDLNK